jgi:hypothetical protein
MFYLLRVQLVMNCRGGSDPVVLSVRFDKSLGSKNGNLFISKEEVGRRRLYCDSELRLFFDDRQVGAASPPGRKGDTDR